MTSGWLTNVQSITTLNPAQVLPSDQHSQEEAAQSSFTSTDSQITAPNVSLVRQSYVKSTKVSNQTNELEIRKTMTKTTSKELCRTNSSPVDSGIQTFRCCYDKCKYESTRRDSTIAHIRRLHFYQPYKLYLNQQETIGQANLDDSCDPNTYIKV